MGSISAWAEEPASRHLRVYGFGVDLRVGGGAGSLIWPSEPRAGRSPRGRRSRGRVASAGVGRGSISAWAEEPTTSTTGTNRQRVDLRVGGGAFIDACHFIFDAGRSPRGRRSLLKRHHRVSDEGSISAWAEEPHDQIEIAREIGVDLRVGGGAIFVQRVHRADEGRSPRGRRSLRIDRLFHGGTGSISAWAEEPSGRTGSAAVSRVDLRVGGGANEPP